MGVKEGVGAIVGGFVTVLIGMYLISPLATSVTSTAGQNASAYCTIWNSATHTCTTGTFKSAGSILLQIPTIFAIGLLITGIVMIVLGALAIKD